MDDASISQPERRSDGVLRKLDVVSSLGHNNGKGAGRTESLVSRGKKYKCGIFSIKIGQRLQSALVIICRNGRETWGKKEKSDLGPLDKARQAQV